MKVFDHENLELYVWQTPGYTTGQLTFKNTKFHGLLHIQNLENNYLFSKS